MQVQNPQAGEIIRDQAGLTLAEGFPQNLSSSIIPIMDMTPDFHREVPLCGGNSSTGTGAITLLTASNTKKTYITSLTLGIVKDVTCDAGTSRLAINATIGGVSRNIICIPTLTLTAQSSVIAIEFSKPIQIDKGSLLTVASYSFAAGNCIRSGSVTAYET